MNRLEELDSIRGFAALTVVNWHFVLMVFLGTPSLIILSPIYFFFAGSEAVIFFFVLSGFVMALPFLKENNSVFYQAFLLKRIFRIYIPYLIGILFTFLLSKLFDISQVEGLSTWFSNKWATDINLNIILDHLFLLGNFGTSEFNPVIWSLIHELRISLVFPLIMILVIKYNWKISLAIGLILSGISQLNNVLSFQISVGYHTSYFDTFHYVLMFIVGSLAAKHKESLIQCFQGLNKLYKYLLVALGFLLYVYSRAIPIVGNKLGLSMLSKLNLPMDLGVTIGAIIFIFAVLSSNKLNKLFLNQLFVLNGRMSYSLYLYHVPVMLTVIYLFYEKIPNLIVFVLAYTITFIVSFLTYKYIEIPSINWGRKISKKIQLTKRGIEVSN